MRVGEGLFWSAISLWGIFFEHPAPEGCGTEGWRRLEAAAFRLYSSLGDLRRAGDVASTVDLLERMRRVADECDERLGELAGTELLCERARLHLGTLRRELDHHRRDALLPGRAPGLR